MDKFEYLLKEMRDGHDESHPQKDNGCPRKPNCHEGSQPRRDGESQ
jgi:hypothetical protein